MTESNNFSKEILALESHIIKLDFIVKYKGQSD